MGRYVYHSRNLPLDLLYNVMLESTGRLQKCRIYEMTDNPVARATIAYLIVRDQAHANAYAKALDTLGVQWNKLLPIPKTNAEQFPEVKELLDLGLRNKQYSFDVHVKSEARRIFQGVAAERRHDALSDRAGPGRSPLGDLAGVTRGVRAGPRHRAAGDDPEDGRGRACRDRGVVRPQGLRRISLQREWAPVVASGTYEVATNAHSRGGWVRRGRGW